MISEVYLEHYLQYEYKAHYGTKKDCFGLKSFFVEVA